MLLADFGAEVIKIERPVEGDDTRSWGPPWFGAAKQNRIVCTACMSVADYFAGRGTSTPWSALAGGTHSM